MVKVQQEDNTEDAKELKQVDSQDNDKEINSKNNVIYTGNLSKLVSDLELIIFLQFSN